ncbi:MAG TPA: Uma2 family endonuclease [Pyrinomonadaceae bacterium]|nr:Uma2 family endonuclease [Pyrinomonadaceae bacterium]
MQALTPSDEVDFSRRYTLEEFWALPEREDHARYELIGGFLYIVPPPNPPHGDLASDLAKALITFLYVNNVDGKVYFPHEPVYLRTEGSTYLEPDLMYVSKALRERMGSKRTLADVVFEVISRGTRVYDYTTKANAYLTLDVRELWLVDRFTLTVQVHYRVKAGDTPVWEIVKYSNGEYAKSRVLAGWEVSVDELFKDLR